MWWYPPGEEACYHPALRVDGYGYKVLEEAWLHCRGALRKELTEDVLLSEQARRRLWAWRLEQVRDRALWFAVGFLAGALSWGLRSAGG